MQAIIDSAGAEASAISASSGSSDPADTLHPTSAFNYERGYLGRFIGQKNYENLKYDMKYMTPLMRASCYGQMEIVEKVLQRKPEMLTATDPNNTTALHLACGFSQPDIAQVLITACPALLDAVDCYGWSALHCSCISPYQPASPFDILMTAQPALLHKLDEVGRSVLHVACVNGELPTVLRILKEPRAIHLVHLKDQNGFLPLHDACHRGGNLELVKLLWELYPESILEEDASGRTLLELAQSRAGKQPQEDPVFKFLEERPNKFKIREWTKQIGLQDEYFDVVGAIQHIPAGCKHAALIRQALQGEVLSHIRALFNQSKAKTSMSQQALTILAEGRKLEMK